MHHECQTANKIVTSVYVYIYGVSLIVLDPQEVMMRTKAQEQNV